MPLTKEQQDQLDELERLRDEPDHPEPAPGGGTGRMLNFNIDLGDPDQVERAFEMGLLERPDAPADPTGDDPPGDDPPRRRGFFDDKDD